VRVNSGAENVRNFTQCDSLLLGDQCGAHTVPYIEVKNPSAQIEHEATTSKISDDQMFYAQQRGLNAEDAVALIVNGFAKEVLQQLPMEFAVEAQKLLDAASRPQHTPFESSGGSSGVENRSRDVGAGILDGRVSTLLDAARTERKVRDAQDQQPPRRNRRQADPERADA
jgi:hypothetical protein